MGAGNSGMSQVILKRELEKRMYGSTMDVKRHRLSEDVKKLTTAAAKLKLHTKHKDKVHSEKSVAKEKVQLEKAFAKEQQAVATVQVQEKLPSRPKPPVAVGPSSKGLPHHIVAATRVVTERRWSLTDLLQNLGVYVQKHCTHLPSIPSASEIAMWVRCADRALQLNGWTVNSFLLESHVVFTYMLLTRAFQQFTLRTLSDAKELVLMCLYISYTYNANEISYPLRPFLVKHDKVAFWDKCTRLSLDSSSCMLRLNQEPEYYVDVLLSLKRVTSF